MKQSHICDRIAFGALLLIGVAGLTSCSDDNIGSPDPASGREIRFEVTEASGWRPIGSQSRSRSADAESVLALRSGDSTELYLHPMVEEGIELSGKASSRGSALGVDGMESFGVFASLNDGEELSDLSPAYMFNVEISNSNDWAPVEKYLWPGSGTLHINAISPYCVAAGQTGITSLPTSTSKCPLSIDFVTPQNVADQFDLMYSDPVDGSSSPCQLVFNHALTAIKFATGSEMVPCTIQSISITGVADRGTLNIETGEWSGLSGSEDFTVSPGQELVAGTGKEYVDPGVALTSENETFLLLPQSLSDQSKITLDIEINGRTSRLEASLDDQKWLAGTTVTYRLSASPDDSSLIFEVVDTDGNPLTDISTPYTGGSISYKVRSLYTAGNGTEEPIEWSASFVTSDKLASTEKPTWIIGLDESGSGETECTLTTDLPDPTFLAMSEQTSRLRSAADINETSGLDRYNLSNSTGASGVENTANCYIVNAPGKYSFPLVYGNAVSEGVKNEGSYISTLQSTASNRSHALLHFINHLGNEITDPYIYNNVSCDPHDAVLMWEDRLNLVRNVALSADGHSIEFEVPAASIRQGNAMLAVRDADGTVMWSWQVWITDYKPSEDILAIPQNGTVSHLYSRSLGTIYEGDRTEFVEGQVTLRLTQKNVPDGQTAQTIDIPVSRAGKILDTKDCYSFYQFGRKDPIVTGLDQYYDAAHNELSGTNIPTLAYGTDQLEMIKKSICHPNLFFTGTTSGVHPYYLNMWDISHLRLKTETPMPENVKTIYDPSPVGAKVPVGNVFRTLVADNAQMTYDETTELATFIVDGEEFRFLALGYRQPTGGEPAERGIGAYWTAAARAATTMAYFSINSRQLRKIMSTNMPLYGFAVRPVLETN